MTLDSPSTRLAALRSAIGDSVSAIREAARILALMEAAGDDLRDVPRHMLSMLRRITAGQILPEVAVRMAGRLRACVSSLPIVDQRRLIEPDATVPLALPGDDSMVVSIHRLTPGQLRQVFGDGYIREVAEQRAVLTNGHAGPQGRKAGAQLVRVDKEAGTVTYHGYTITKSTLLRWLSEL